MNRLWFLASLLACNVRTGIFWTKSKYELILLLQLLLFYCNKRKKEQCKNAIKKIMVENSEGSMREIVIRQQNTSFSCFTLEQHGQSLLINKKQKTLTYGVRGTS